MAEEIIKSTTQQFLDIHDITNNLVIMKDGTVSVIITVDAMNFGLLAEEEQDAVMYAYAGLLNSINYTVQIVIHSQTKDVTSYLQLLKDQENEAVNETMQKRIRLYREFVGNLIHERNVLDKKFYVVIPANSIELGLMGAKTVLPGQTAFDIGSVERSVIIEKALNILEPRRDHLIAQFARIGLYSRQLSTQEIIQLFYVRYNPEAIEGQQIAESNSYTSPLVQASIQGNFMMNDMSTPNPTVGGLVDQSQQPQVEAAPPTQPIISPEVPAAPPVAAPVNPEPMTPAPMSPVTPVSETSGPATTAPMSPAPAMSTELPVTPATSVETPATPAAIPTPTPVAPVSADVAAIQADIDATVQQLGGTVPQTTPTIPTTETVNTASTKSDDLPPLPEI